jgi:hypothetical protein
MDQKILNPSYIVETLSSNYLNKIGEIIVKWNLVDYHLGFIIIIGFKLPTKTGRALTYGMSIPVKIKTIKEMIKSDTFSKDSNLKKEIDFFIKNIKKCEIKRHNIAHGIFGVDLDERKYCRLLLKENPSEIAIKAIKITIQELEETLSEITRLIDHGILLTNKIQALHKKFP